MKSRILTLTGLVTIAAIAHAIEFHVATDGSDANRGTKRAPLRTIQRAADLAHPLA